jgi:hypothetical protein
LRRVAPRPRGADEHVSVEEHGIAGQLGKRSVGHDGKRAVFHMDIGKDERRGAQGRVD